MQLFRWLMIGVLTLIVATPLLMVPKVEEQRALSARTAPAKRREPMPVQPTLPNAYRLNPVPRPLQA